MELSEKLTRNHFIKISDDLCQYHNKITNTFGPAFEIKEAEKWHEDYIIKFARCLDKYFSPNISRPKRLEKPNLDSLYDCIEGYMNQIEEDDHDDLHSDYYHYIYESAIIALYGKEFFKWLNSKRG